MQIDLVRTLQDGVKAHGAGDLAAAAEAYRRILDIAPGHADANHLLGLVHFQSANTDKALNLIEKAIAADGGVALYHANRGRVLMAAADAKTAVRAFRDALSLTPEDASLHNDLASAMLALGDADGARARAERALEIAPDNANAAVNLGLALQNLYGNAYAQARAAFERARAVDPKLAGAALGLGLFHHEAGDTEAARKAYREALAVDPNLVEAHCNLGNIARERCDFAAAVEHYEAALNVDDGQATVLGNLAVAVHETGDLDRALDIYERAVAIASEDADIRRNRGMALLAAGRYAEGWLDYEYRWQTARFRRMRRDFNVPMWDGRDPNGLRLFVHAEQGLGDTLQFCRYLPLLAGMGAKVTFECADQLQPLIRCLPGVRRMLTPGGVPADIDAHVPLLSLPGLLETTTETVPADIPYLSAPAAFEEKWAKIAAGWPAGRRIGIAWRGSPDHPRDTVRSPGLAPFMALAAPPNAVLVSLQVTGAADELAVTPGAEKIVDPAVQIEDFADTAVQIEDFADTAGLMMQLDWIVSCDSAPLHLAGALGRRAVAVLPQVPEWRWGRGDTPTPWYPAMHLVRQPAPGDWEGAFDTIRQLIV